jgi:hypothetical protein
MGPHTIEAALMAADVAPACAATTTAFSAGAATMGIVENAA